MEVLDLIENEGFPSWGRENWAKKEFEDEQARKQKEMWDREEERRKREEEEEERRRVEELKNKPKVRAKDRRKKK